MKTKNEPAKAAPIEVPKWLEVVRESVEEVRFGTVQIVIHDGRVTQVDATRRTRLTEPTSV
jgi:hypothetical protein